MGQKADRGAGGGAGDGGHDNTVAGQLHILRANLGQFLPQQVQHVELNFRAGGRWRRLIALAVDGCVTDQPVFKFLIKSVLHNTSPHLQGRKSANRNGVKPMA